MLKVKNRINARRISRGDLRGRINTLFLKKFIELNGLIDLNSAPGIRHQVQLSGRFLLLSPQDSVLSPFFLDT